MASLSDFDLLGAKICYKPRNSKPLSNSNEYALLKQPNPPNPRKHETALERGNPTKQKEPTCTYYSLFREFGQSSETIEEASGSSAAFFKRNEADFTTGLEDMVAACSSVGKHERTPNGFSKFNLHESLASTDLSAILRMDTRNADDKPKATRSVVVSHVRPPKKCKKATNVSLQGVQSHKILTEKKLQAEPYYAKAEFKEFTKICQEHVQKEKRRFSEEMRDKKRRRGNGALNI